MLSLANVETEFRAYHMEKVGYQKHVWAGKRKAKSNDEVHEGI